MEANIGILSLVLSIRKVTASIFSANDEHSDARFLFDSFFPIRFHDRDSNADVICSFGDVCSDGKRGGLSAPPPSSANSRAND